MLLSANRSTLLIENFIKFHDDKLQLPTYIHKYAFIFIIKKYIFKDISTKPVAGCPRKRKIGQIPEPFKLSTLKQRRLDSMNDNNEFKNHSKEVC